MEVKLCGNMTRQPKNEKCFKMVLDNTKKSAKLPSVCAVVTQVFFVCHKICVLSMGFKRPAAETTGNGHGVVENLLL